MLNTLSLIIPAYNEAISLHLILNRIREFQLINIIQKQNIIVDDSSKDVILSVIENHLLENNLNDIFPFSNKIITKEKYPEAD